MSGSAVELRRVLLLLVLVASVGLVAELLLLEHTESWTQWIPVVVLAAGVASAAALWLRPSRRSMRVFQAVMLGLVAAGIAGLWLHFAGNRAFELEMEPDQGGWLLAWRSLRGATPALAPGAMIQVGLLGLALGWRHPILTRTPEETNDR